MPDRNQGETVAPEPEDESDQGLEDDRSRTDRHIDEQEEESFPASDPHADWSGGPSV
jgi:hypothetical protein